MSDNEQGLSGQKMFFRNDANQLKPPGRTFKPMVRLETDHEAHAAVASTSRPQQDKKRPEVTQANERLYPLCHSGYCRIANPNSVP